MGENNFRLTNQRAIILEYIKDNYNHPTVEDVYSVVKQKLPRISKKTVYTNLRFLVEKGMISEVNVKGVQRYEPKLHPHHHVLCKRCGKIKDFDSEKLVKYSMMMAKEIEDYDIEGTATNFYGVCRRCRRKKDGKI